MATRSRQHGATAKQGRTARGTRQPARARSSAPRRPAKSPRRHSYLVPLAIVLALVAAAWSFYPVARVQYREERQKAHLQAELEGLQERNATLRAQVDRLKTPEGVEEVARENLGMVKEGESLYRVVEDGAAPATTTAEPSTAAIPEQETSLWDRTLDALFGMD